MQVTYERGLRRVGARTQAFLQPDGGWGWSNAGLIEGDGDAILVDTFFDLKLTRELLDAVGRPVSVLVNTHHNADHTFGNQLVGASRIIGHRRCKEALESGPTPAVMAALRDAPDASGGLAYMQKVFGPFDPSGVEITPPTEVFDDAMTVEVGGRTVELRYFGPAHTLGDIAVHVPDDGVVFCGDLGFIGSTPLVWEGSFANWIAAADALIALDAGTYVPGHGPVSGEAGLREMQDYLRLVLSEAARSRASGLPPLEAALRADLGPYASWKDAERIGLNMLRVYKELDGEPPESGVELFEAFDAMAQIAAARTG